MKGASHIINTMLSKMKETGTDVALVKMLTEDYPANPYTMVTVAQKLTLTAMMEAGMRAKTGAQLQRPIGSPVVLSPWDKILFNPKQLFQLPTPSLIPEVQ